MKHAGSILFSAFLIPVRRGLIAVTGGFLLNLATCSVIAEDGSSGVGVNADVMQQVKTRIAREKDPVATLVSLTKDPRSDMRGAALLLLGEYSDERIIVPLVQALQDPEQNVRWTATQVLSELKDPALVPAIEPLLKSEVPVIRRMAVIVVARVKSDAVAGVLIGLLKDPEWLVRSEAAQQLSGYAKNEDVFDALVKTMAEDEHPSVRTGAAYSLVSFQSFKEHAARALRKGLKDPDWHVRAASAMALARLPDQTAIPDIEPLLRDPYALVRDNATEALAILRSHSSVPALLAIMRNPKLAIYDRVARVLPHLTTPVIVKDIVPLFEEKEAVETRITVAILCAEFAAAESAPALIKALKDKDAYVSAYAAEALGNIKSQEAVSALLDVLNHPNFFVRGKAAEALGKIGNPDARDGLTKLLDDKTSFVKKQASSALALLPKRD